METIKTDISRLFEFIGNGYGLRENLETTEGQYELYFEKIWNFNDKEIVLFSMVRKINLPDMSYYPQLKSLYGVPAGLLSVTNYDIKENNPDELIESCHDKRYSTIRRSLFYAVVWYLKSLKNYDPSNVDVIKNIVQSIVREKDGFAVSLMNDLIEQNWFPEEVPSKVSISNSHYQYSFLWFAHKISDYYFNGEKMPVSCKDWFISLRDNTLDKIPPIPQELNNDVYAFVAYVLVLKAIAGCDYSTENIVKMSTSISDPLLRQNVLFFSLLLVGRYNSMADHYYFTCNANAIMTVVEKSAYLISNGFWEDLAFEWDSAFESLRSINPKDNCVNYYQTKFPSLQGRSWFDYSIEEKQKSRGELIMLPPELSDKFIISSGRIFDIHEKMRKSIFLINEQQVPDFDAFSFSYISKTARGRFDVVLRKFSPKSKVEIISMEDANVVKKSIPMINVDKVTPMVDIHSKVWVVQISARKGFSPFIKSLLMQAYAYAKPELILLVYHYDEKMLSVKSKDGSQIPFDPAGYKAKLQRVMETIFPASTIRIINHNDDEEMWESVNSGEKILEHYDFEDICILEFRSKQSRVKDASFILRMIRDVVVYDEQMKYLFMNLS